MQASLADIATLIQGTVVGDDTIIITTLSALDNITANALVFVDSDVNLEKAQQSAAGAIIVNQKITDSVKPIIQVNQPLKAFITLINFFYPPTKLTPNIHPTAIIAKDVTLGKQVYIGPYVVINAGSTIGDYSVIHNHVSIGEKVTIGAHNTIYPQVTIYDNSQLGDRVIIHASSVIGSDGFGYTFVDGKHLKIPHVGRVTIHDDVEIGANSVVDRATMDETIVGKGSKIDNLVQVAHNVKLGEHNILCAFTGVAGSSVSGNHVIFAANVGVSDHVIIDDGVILAARAGVPSKKHLLTGNIYLGNPARPKAKALEQELGLTRLPMMRKKLRSLQEKIAVLEKRLAVCEEENA